MKTVDFTVHFLLFTTTSIEHRIMMILIVHVIFRSVDCLMKSNMMTKTMAPLSWIIQVFIGVIGVWDALCVQSAKDSCSEWHSNDYVDLGLPSKTRMGSSPPRSQDALPCNPNRIIYILGFV